MELTRHCNLCDHQKTDFIIGTTCGLTGQKPAFSNTCSKIALNEKFEEQLKETNIRYRHIKRQQPITYLYFSTFMIIGLAVIIGGYLLGEYVWEHGALSTVPLIIMAVGLGPLGLAIGTLNKHRQELQSAKTRKQRIDEVLDRYRITYTLDIHFGKSYHGTQEVQVDLQLKKPF